MRKKLMVVAGIVLVLGALLAFALVNLDSLVKRNKDYILAQAEQALGRKVAVDDIGVTLWGGIGVRLKNFALADDKAFSQKDALRAADLQVNVEFLPLLWKEVRVTRLILREPAIHVIRNKRGELNFATVGATAHEKPAKPPPGETPPAAALPLLVSQITVSGGEVHYVDHTDGTNLRIKAIDLTVKDLGFDRPVSIELAAAVAADRQNVKFNGKAGPVPPTLDTGTAAVEGNIEARALDITAIERSLPRIKQYLPQGLNFSGPLDFKAKVSGTAQALTLSGVDLRAAVFGAGQPNFQYSGRIGPLGNSATDLSMTGDVTLGPVTLASLTRFAPLAGTLPKELSGDGPLSLTAHVDGTLEQLALKGTLEATASEVRYGDSFRKPKGVPFVVSTDARVTTKEIALQKADMKLHTLELTGVGAMTRGKVPTLRLTLDSGRTDLGGWEKILPMLQEYKLAGNMELHTRIQGAVGNARLPDVNGSLTFTGLRAALPPIAQPVTVPSATVTFTGQGAALPETPLRVGKSDARLKVQVERFSPMALTYSLSSPELWLADIRKLTESPKKPEVLREVTDTGRVSTKDGSAVYQGRFLSGRGTVADIDYTQLEALVSVANQVLTIQSLKLRAYNGTLQGQGRYDFREVPPRFTLTSQLRDVDVSQLFHAPSATATKYIRGGANLDLNLAGSGDQWEDIQRTLTGQGKAEVVKGALLDVNIAESALTGLTGVPGLSVFISPNTREKYPGIFRTQNTEFGQLKGSLALREGKIHLDDLLISASDWTAAGKGWVTLDQSVGLQARLAFSPQLSTDLINEIKPLRYLRDPQGRLTIPFTLGGTLPRVTPKPDVDHVARLVQRGLVEQGVKGLTEGLLKQTVPPSQQTPPQEQQSPATPQQPTPPQEEKPEEKFLRGLKDIFGR